MEKRFPVTKVSREATQLKKSEGARETLRSARERIKRNKENKPKICNKENQGTAKRVNVIFSDEPTMEKGVIEDYLKNLLPTKMSFTLIDAKSTNLKTCFVIVEFPSTNQARKAVTSLLKTSSRTKVKAHSGGKGSCITKR